MLYGNNFMSMGHIGPGPMPIYNGPLLSPYSQYLQLPGREQSEYYDRFLYFMDKFDISYSKYGPLLRRVNDDLNKLVHYYSSLESDDEDKKSFCENHLAFKDMEKKLKGKGELSDKDEIELNSVRRFIHVLYNERSKIVKRSFYNLNIHQSSKDNIRYSIVSKSDMKYELYVKAMMIPFVAKAKVIIIPVVFDALEDAENFIKYYELKDVTVNTVMVDPEMYIALYSKKEEKEMSKEENKEIDEVIAATELKDAIKVETRRQLKKKFNYIPKFLRKAMLMELTEKDINEIVEEVNAEVPNKVTGGSSQMTGGLAKVYEKALKRLGFSVDMEELQKKVKIIAADTVRELIQEWKEKGDIK